jgi:hypothetical protein
MTDTEKLNIALDMLAMWCAQIENNGTNWDDWDESYKDCSRPGPLTEEIQRRKEEFNKLWEYDNTN